MAAQTLTLAVKFWEQQVWSRYRDAFPYLTLIFLTFHRNSVCLTVPSTPSLTYLGEIAKSAISSGFDLHGDYAARTDQHALIGGLSGTRRLRYRQPPVGIGHHAKL